MWKFQTNRTKKWRSYSLYKFSSCVTRGVYIYRPLPLGQSYHLQGGSGIGVGNGQMYCFFLWKLSTNAVPTEWWKANRFTRTPTSVTHETSWREVAQYVLLSADLSLASLSDISKLDCTGQKVDNLRNYWAYIAVFGLILKWKSHAIAQHCAFSQFIDRIFLNRCKDSKNHQNFNFFICFNFI